MSDQAHLPWVTLQRVSELTGLSVNALREYIKKGLLKDGEIVIRARNGRRMIHIVRFREWLENTAA